MGRPHSLILDHCQLVLLPLRKHLQLCERRSQFRRLDLPRRPLVSELGELVA